MTETTSPLVLARTPVTAPEAVAIIREYLRELTTRFHRRPATEAEVDAVVADEPGTELVAPFGAFLLASAGRGTAGCVGVRLIADGIAELTKMYVRPSARGRGVGRRLIAAAENAARELGAGELRLITRTDLVEARGLYEAAGFVEIPAYTSDDPYAEHWYGKPL